MGNIGRVQSIKISIILNGLKTLLSIVFPLITFPYVARVLQAENLGKVNYAQSIVSYFSLIAALGINTYAVREGSKLREDNKQFGIFANQIFTINLITTAFSYMLLIVTLLSVKGLHGYEPLIVILSLSFGFITLGIDWINIIFEDYFYITVRSFLIQIVNIMLLFILVKNKNDYYIYSLLIVSSQILIGISNLFYCRRYCKIKISKKFNFQIHLKPMAVLFANDIAVTLYCSSDSTMIGWLVSDYYVGIYAVAVKVYSMIRSLLASVFLVCITRLSYYLGKKEIGSFKSLVSSIMECILLILFPAITGLIVLAEPIVLILGGIAYRNAILTLQILSIGLGFAIIGGVFTNCINIPLRKEKINLYATMTAAVLNITLNLFFIPYFKQNGAAVTTVFAELTVIVVCVICDNTVLKYFSYKELLRNSSQAAGGCFLIVVLSLFVKKIIKNPILICISVFGGAVALYGILLIVLKNKYMTAIIMKLKNRLMRNK